MNNTEPYKEPFTLDSLKGKVVLIDFWTYSCINCIRTLPYLKEWNAKYRDKGLVIIGVHTPEFEFEKNSENVKDAVKRFGLEYPVVLDNHFKTWQNFNNHYWPAHYLIDQKGFIRSFHFGEGEYLETENAIRSLLGLEPLQENQATQSQAEQVGKRPITPETYLGFDRGWSYTASNAIEENRTALYDDDAGKYLRDDQVGLSGLWRSEPQKIIAEGKAGGEGAENGRGAEGAEDKWSELDLNFLATQVYLVMESEAEEPARIAVYLDGKPLERKYYTKDMDERGHILVKEARKYDVVDLKKDYGRHLLTLRVPKGTSLYAFTFGDED